jgi:glycerol-3-phosphate dehydrogenase (NAD(P)+)
MEIQTIGVIGGGAWGTALAAAARFAGRSVVIQAREEEAVTAINETHENTPFLPGVPLDAEIRATMDLSEACAADAILTVVPAQHFRATASSLKACGLDPKTPLVICSKGIEQKTGALMSEVLKDVLPETPFAVLSGPTFAAEVARNLPCAVTLACSDEALGLRLADALGTPYFRTYLSNDPIGAQLGGAVKNVLAVACGIIEGKNFGDNARAALITRSLGEIIHLGRTLGAKAETIMGLSGLGDLTLTCNAMQSRNFSLGVALGQGKALNEVLGKRTAVTEGVFTAASIIALANRLGADVPICSAVDQILNHDADIDSVIQALLARPFKIEEW